MNLYTKALLSKNLKFAVTGHSSGIGRAIFETFDCIGFSRSNGFDITCSESRKKIIDESSSCDIFVNCAFDLYSQIDLLYELERNFLGKYIVNLSSNSGDGIKTTRHRYATIKSALDKASEQLCYLSEKRIINLRPGYVDTERVKDIDAKKIAPESFLEVMSFSILSDCLVKEVTFIEK